MTQYNIYFGTIGTGAQYQFTKKYKDEQSAKRDSYKSVRSFYFKNEGTKGLPSYNQIAKESELTGVDIEKLYDEHIYDLCRWYVVPTELDTIPSRKLKYD